MNAVLHIKDKIYRVYEVEITTYPIVHVQLPSVCNNDGVEIKCKARYTSDIICADTDVDVYVTIENTDTSYHLPSSTVVMSISDHNWNSAELIICIYARHIHNIQTDSQIEKALASYLGISVNDLLKMDEDELNLIKEGYSEIKKEYRC